MTNKGSTCWKRHDLPLVPVKAHCKNVLARSGDVFRMEDTRLKFSLRTYTSSLVVPDHHCLAKRLVATRKYPLYSSSENWLRMVPGTSPAACTATTPLEYAALKMGSILTAAHVGGNHSSSIHVPGNAVCCALMELCRKPHRY